MRDKTIDILLKDLCERESGPLTQDEIADSVGCSRQYISKIELSAISKIEAVIPDELRDACNFDILSGLNKG